MRLSGSRVTVRGMTLALTEEQELLRSPPPTSSTARSCRTGPAGTGTSWSTGRSSAGSVNLGFLGLTLPEELGGTPVDSRSYCLMMEELGRGDSAIRGIVSVSLGLVAKSIAAYGTADQRKEWVPGLPPARRWPASG